MSVVIHAEVIVVGAFTGTLIGFFWHPVGAAAALALGAVLALGSRDGRPGEAHS
jgi:hypothetical protein